MNMQLLFPACEQSSPVCMGKSCIELTKRWLKLPVCKNILNMQNADDARNANEWVHIYGTKFFPWVITAGGQEVHLGAVPVLSITPCVVTLTVTEINFQCRRQKKTADTEYLLLWESSVPVCIWIICSIKLSNVGFFFPLGFRAALSNFNAYTWKHPFVYFR